MRHYFGYDVSGRLKTIEVYGPVGWPATHCMEDADCHEKSVDSLRESRVFNAPDVVGWVLYDCPCDPEQNLVRDCVCFNAQYANHYVQAGVFVLKPVITPHLDNVAFSSGDIITKNPGTTVSVHFVAPGIADGETIHCVQKGSIDLCEENEFDLVFTGGVSTAKTLTAPAQGSKGFLTAGGHYIRPFSFSLRGFTLV